MIKKIIAFQFCIILLVFFYSCTPQKIQTAPAKTSHYSPIKEFYQEGIASWYGKKFHHKRTSNGEIYDMYRLTAAHRTLPFHTFVLVKNLQNSRTVTVRINDRGPFVKGRIIDLSHKSAEQIGIIDQGTANVKLVIVKSPPAQTKPVTLKPPSQIEKSILKDEENIFIKQTLFTIQAGAFSSIENAVNTVEKINDRILDYRFKIELINGYYKIRLRTPVPLNIAERILKILKNNHIKAFKKKISNQDIIHYNDI